MERQILSGDELDGLMGHCKTSPFAGIKVDWLDLQRVFDKLESYYLEDKMRKIEAEPETDQQISEHQQLNCNIKIINKTGSIRQLDKTYFESELTFI